jgi:hypothetical protein
MLDIPAWLQIAALALGVLGWIGDKLHAAVVRHREHQRAMSQTVRDLTTVSEDECLHRRTAMLSDLDAKCDSCQKNVDTRLNDGDDAFDWLSAVTSLLARKAGITSQEIQEEIALRRRTSGGARA